MRSNFTPEAVAAEKDRLMQCVKDKTLDAIMVDVRIFELKQILQKRGLLATKTEDKSESKPLNNEDKSSVEDSKVEEIQQETIEVESKAEHTELCEEIQTSLEENSSSNQNNDESNSDQRPEDEKVSLATSIPQEDAESEEYDPSLEIKLVEEPSWEEQFNEQEYDPDIPALTEVASIADSTDTRLLIQPDQPLPDPPQLGPQRKPFGWIDVCPFPRHAILANDYGDSSTFDKTPEEILQDELKKAEEQQREAEKTAALLRAHEESMRIQSDSSDDDEIQTKQEEPKDMNMYCPVIPTTDKSIRTTPNLPTVPFALCKPRPLDHEHPDLNLVKNLQSHIIQKPAGGSKPINGWRCGSCNRDNNVKHRSCLYCTNRRGERKFFVNNCLIQFFSKC